MILDGTKIAWHKDRVEAWLAGEHIAPITVDCALTRRCNYHCMYCYAQFQENDEKRMTRDVIFRFLDDAAEVGVKAIQFLSDGESTCVPHVYDTLLRAKSNGMDVGLGTNGSLLRDERLEEILPVLTYLRFNISAADSKRYAEVMGCEEKCYFKVINTIKECVRIKKKHNLAVTLNMSMVLMPQFASEILPFVKLGKELGVDYTIIKHCSDNENHELGIDYSRYHDLVPIIKQAQGFGDEKYMVAVKWSKMLSNGERNYSRCYGPPFFGQISGSGLVAPCGVLFNRKFKKYHISNIVDQSYKEIVKSDRYWEVMNELASERFDSTKCGVSFCVQHNTNDYLWRLKQGDILEKSGNPPEHVNFI